MFKKQKKPGPNHPAEKKKGPSASVFSRCFSLFPPPCTTMSKQYNPGQVTFFSDKPKSPKELEPLDLSYPKLQPELDQRVDMFDYAHNPPQPYDQLAFAGLQDPLAPVSPSGAMAGAPAYNAFGSPLLNMMPVKREWRDDQPSLRELATPNGPPGNGAPNGVPNGGPNGGPQAAAARPRTKSAHNVIEQRYRNKINDKFTALQNAVPTLRVLARKKSKTRSDDEDDDDEYEYSPDLEAHEDLEGLEPARKLNKGTILTKSVEYIKFLERKNDRMKAERYQLVERARMLGIVLDESMLDRYD